jgi:RNA polymerase sigma-70 factor, ECF subfamily
MAYEGRSGGGGEAGTGTGAAGEVTRILAAAADGDSAAADRLFPLVYDELRALASHFFERQPANHTLQPTALVHDAFLRLVGQPAGAFRDRTHFMAVAAKAMRQILTDHARRRAAQKRGGEWSQIAIDDGALAHEGRQSVDVLALDEALGRLATLDERKARVVELRFFGGLTNDEAAESLGVSRATIADDWTVARTWLRSELSRDSARDRAGAGSQR